MYACAALNLVQDMYVIAVGMALYAVRENDLLAIQLYMGFTLLSMPFDIAWLATHSDVSFWGVSATVEGLNSFVVAMCIIALLIKVPILYFAHQFKSSVVGSHPGAKSLLDQPGWRLVTLFSCFICYFGSFFQGLARVDPFAFVVRLSTCLLTRFWSIQPVACFCQLLFAIYAIRETDVKAIDMFWLFTVWCIILDITWVSVTTETAHVGTAETSRRVQALRTEYIFVVCFSVLLRMFTRFFRVWGPSGIRSNGTLNSAEVRDASLPLSLRDGEATSLSNELPRKYLPFADDEEARWAHVSYGMLITSMIVCILSLASTSDYRADLYPVALICGFYAVHERVSCCNAGCVYIDLTVLLFSYAVAAFSRLLLLLSNSALQSFFS
jgi:hypothetical protein